MLADHELLHRYCADRSESDFAELVRRHADLVYASALRQLNGNGDLARDVTQIVFADLARKGISMAESRSLAGWLYTSARYAAANLARSEKRRQHREQEAFAMNSSDPVSQPAADPAVLRPLIEEAMHALDEADREMVLLRYFEGRDFKSVGNCVGISSEAARKRVVRAIERLRGVLQQRGICSSEAGLTGALLGAAALSVPGDLHASVLRSALASSVSAPTAMSHSLFRISQMKTALALTGLALGVGTALVLQHASAARLRMENSSLAARLSELTRSSSGGRTPAEPDELRDELARLRKEHLEVLRLRDEVTRLRGARRERLAAESADPLKEEQALAPAQVTIEAKFYEGSTSMLKKLAMDTVGFDVTGVGTTAILTDPQARALLEGLKSGPGDLLAAPRVTTLNNRPASISVVPVDVSGGTGVDLGPSADFLPTVSADKLSISLQATAGLGEKVPVQDATGAESEQVRQTKVSGNGVLWDGQTLILCQRIGQPGGAGVTPAEDPLSLLVLVTPTLIDPAGNRIHPGDEVAASVPPRKEQ